MTGGIERGGGHGAQIETKTAVSAEEVAAAAEIGGQSEETKRGMVGMKGAGEKTGTPTKTGAQRENGPGTGRTGRTRRTADTKTIGSGTERRERSRGAEVEAKKKGTKVRKKKAGNVSEATAVRENETEMQSHALTNAAAAKKDPIISASLVMNTVNTVSAEGVRALIESRSCFYYILSTFVILAHQTSGNVLAQWIVAFCFMHFYLP